MVITLGVSTATANDKKKESKNKEVITSTTFMTNINCEKCEKKILNYIPFKSGVKDVKVDLRQKSVDVRYDEKKCSDTKLIKYFKKIDIAAKVKPAHTPTPKPTVNNRDNNPSSTSSSNSRYTPSQSGNNSSSSSHR